MSKGVWKLTPSGKTVRRKRHKSPPFVMLPKYMLKSASWASLPVTARAAFIQTALRYDGTNNGRIALAVRKLATELGNLSRPTAARALHHLLERGFIEVVKPSGFNIKGRVAAEYRLTLYRCDVSGDLASKAFMKWHPKNSFHSLTREQFKSHHRPIPPPKTPPQSHQRDREPGFDAFLKMQREESEG